MVKTGRKRRANGLASELVALRLTKSERKSWDRAASATNKALSEWIRDICNSEAAK